MARVYTPWRVSAVKYCSTVKRNKTQRRSSAATHGWSQERKIGTERASAAWRVLGRRLGEGARGTRVAENGPHLDLGGNSTGRCAYRRAPSHTSGFVCVLCANERHWKARHTSKVRATEPRPKEHAVEGPGPPDNWAPRALFSGVFARVFVSLLLGRILPMKLSVLDIFHVGRFFNCWYNLFHSYRTIESLCSFGQIT